ncbi:MAG: hypothetical protein JSV58_01500 [Candidatus Bathyarchaeota archaeon]|nr:MAG: hypothetical protein JSV58_01500 [Candidatus Bathyarchaeota archaeon]
MKVAEVLSGTLLLIVGVLAIAPFPEIGWLYEEFPEFAFLGIVSGGVMSILGCYFIISGFRSTKKSHRADILGNSCLLLSLITLFTALAIEDGNLATSSLVLGFSLLVAGVAVILAGQRRNKKKP